MPYNVPNHLNKKDCSDPTLINNGSELLYRREKFSNLSKGLSEVYVKISSNYIKDGFSVNHSCYCISPFDVIFSYNNGEFEILEEYLPFSAKQIKVHNQKREIGEIDIMKISVSYAPLEGNCSHCNIIFDPTLADNLKKNNRSLYTNLRSIIPIFLAEVFNIFYLKRFIHDEIEYILEIEVSCTFTNEENNLNDPNINNSPFNLYCFELKNNITDESLEKTLSKFYCLLINKFEINQINQNLYFIRNSINREI